MTRVGMPESAKAAWMAHPLVQVAVAACIGALVPYYSLLFGVAWREHANDFGKFYYATRAWLDGGSLYAATVATRMRVGEVWLDFLNLNPPHFHLVMLPFVSLPLREASIAWHLLNLVAALCAGALVGQELGLRPRVVHVLPTVLASLLLSATGAVALTGQFTGLLMLPMVLAWRTARAGRWLACGAWLGFAVALKPFLGFVVLALLVRGGMRLLGGVVAGGSLGFAAGLVVFGWRAHVDWADALGSVSWPWATMNGSVQGVLSRTLTPSPAFVPVIQAAALVTPLWIAAVAVIAVVSLRVARRSLDHAFAASVLGALLISPLGWVYYLWLALPGCLALWRRAVPGLAMLGLAALAVPLFAAQVWGGTGLSTLTIGSAYTWATLLLWISTVRTGPPQTAEG